MGDAVEAETIGAPNILVVDDTIENLRLLSSMLGQHGFEVRPVSSGRQALDAAERKPPDLVLLDVNMPEMNGYEVCRRLKELPDVKDVPVIFLTALSDTQNRLHAFEAGGVDYITKPFQVEEVLARVRAQVSLRQAQLRLKQSYEQLRSMEQLRDDLVHMLVHDMRSPITVLLAHLGFVLADTRSTDTGAAADLENAIKAAKTVNRMASDLLDVSRLEASKMPLVKETCDLVHIAREVRSALGALDRGRQLEVVTNEPVTASCDGVVISRVLENLVHNAIKHTPAGGAIRIGAEPRDDRVRVWVEDAGPGVPAAAREHIFDKFRTLAARSPEGYRSAGLGLAFCKLAVQAHGGTIGVEPGPTRGSVFWFELPR